MILQGYTAKVLLRSGVAVVLHRDDIWSRCRVWRRTPVVVVPPLVPASEDDGPKTRPLTAAESAELVVALREMQERVRAAR